MEMRNVVGRSMEAIEKGEILLLLIPDNNKKKKVELGVVVYAFNLSTEMQKQADLL